MGCATSTSNANYSGYRHNRNETTHHYNQQDTNTNTNTNTNTDTDTKVNTDTKPSSEETAGQSTTNGVYYPDDNAIYGYDLYGDDGEDNKPETVEGDGGYTQTATGLKTVFLDLRGPEAREEDRRESRPHVPRGQVFQDPQFGLHEALADLGLAGSLTWKRPMELSADPKLFSGSTTRFDIGQGGAGTCWFLSTVANISEHSEQLKQVIPEDAYRVGTEDYDGVFHCRFWRFGEWEDVYIDDFLPVVHDTIPWGARSATDDSEFWPSLLEKAFARYHGSYKAVYGGQPGDAYLALTGGVAERIDFDDNENRPRKLYKRIHNAVNSGALVTCTVPDKYDNVCGLVGGHAYSLTGTAVLARGTQLLRVRNPWGNTEWTGAWSDTSPEWRGVSEEEVSRAVKDDGEFWISLHDFMTYFDQTTICSLTPDFDQDGCSDSLNYVTNVYGEWKGQTAAGFREKLCNPRFLFTVPDTGEPEVPVVVQLIQRRKNRQVDNFQVRCDVYKVLHNDGTTATLELMGENTNSYCPETQCSFRHKMSPGTYAVVPSTIEAGLEKSFLIRVFSACPLLRVGELSRGHILMSCDRQSSIDYNGREHALTACKVLPGQWKAGVNAGGQISYRDSHALNPQYLISVNQPTLVAIYLMQEQVDPRMPLGLRLFPCEEAPMDIYKIYDLHEQAVTNTEGSNHKFVQSWDVSTAYMLEPGRYTLLIHMDAPDTEKRYTLVLKSPHRVDVREFQTVV